jgi:hypothetical protein
MNRALALVALVVVLATGCSTTPDKRALQYLNTTGSGTATRATPRRRTGPPSATRSGMTDELHPRRSTALRHRPRRDRAAARLGAVPVAGLTRSEIEAC